MDLEKEKKKALYIHNLEIRKALIDKVIIGIFIGIVISVTKQERSQQWYYLVLLHL